MSEFVLEAGAVLMGKYRIEAVLGRGGMGVVAAAYHLQLEQRVAIKLMLPQALSNPEAVARFLREARAAARISSEHVARVFDVDSLPTGEPFIAMEYLQGADIAQILAKQGRFAPEEAVEYVLQACEALAEAHAAGIVHRDLKPANLYLTTRVNGQRVIKVLDFGISKVTDVSGNSPDAVMTQTATLMGSPLYMSPEQMAATKAADARSDIWSLGVVLYEMLCGASPFAGQTLPQVCLQVVTLPHPPLSQRVPSLPPELLSAVDRCLQKEPEARFQSVAELALALSSLASPRARQSIDRISFVLGFHATQASALDPNVPPRDDGASSSSNLPSAPEIRPSTHATWANTRQPPARQRSRAGLWLALAAGGISLLAPLVWVALRPPSAAEPPRAPSPITSAASSVSYGAASLPVAQVAPEPKTEPPVAPTTSAPLPSSEAPGIDVPARAVPTAHPAASKLPDRATARSPSVTAAAAPVAPTPAPSSRTAASAAASTPSPAVSAFTKSPTPPIRSRL
ncbi:MAG TPA: protein kinase [Polyangiaceae bacterium]|nr:protein kinase [Polyangiaceae bacterium]